MKLLCAGGFYLCVWGPLMYLEFFCASLYRKFDVLCHVQVDDLFAFLPRKFLHNTS